MWIDMGGRPALHSLDKDDLPVGLLTGCRKVRELVPRVRRARFQRESLPSLLGLPDGGDTVGPSDWEFWDMLVIMTVAESSMQ